METNKPMQSFAAGAIRAAIWKNTAKDRSGPAAIYHTVKLERRYLDANKEWQSTQALRFNDLPKARLLLAKAFEYLAMADREEGDAEGAK